RDFLVVAVIGAGVQHTGLQMVLNLLHFSLQVFHGEDIRPSANGSSLRSIVRRGFRWRGRGRSVFRDGCRTGNCGVVRDDFQRVVEVGVVGDLVDLRLLLRGLARGAGRVPTAGDHFAVASGIRIIVPGSLLITGLLLSGRISASAARQGQRQYR